MKRRQVLKTLFAVVGLLPIVRKTPTCLRGIRYVRGFCIWNRALNIWEVHEFYESKPGGEGWICFSGTDDFVSLR